MVQKVHIRDKEFCVSENFHCVISDIHFHNCGHESSLSLLRHTHTRQLVSDAAKINNKVPLLLDSSEMKIVLYA